MAEITCPRCNGSGKVVLAPGLGPMLKYARELKDESLSQAATALGVTKAHIHALENGQSANPSLRTAVKIAAHYNLSLDEVARQMKEPGDG